MVQSRSLQRSAFMKTTLSLALIGAGNWGKNLAKACFDLGVLHTICDSNESALDVYQERYPNINTSGNYVELLANPAIKQVIIATPASTHFEMTKAALEAGKDVLVEKPLCLNSNEGQILVDLAARYNRILMVGHLYHYHPAFIQLQKMVQEGAVGSIKFIHSKRFKLGKFRKEENVLWSFAPHDISMILALTSGTVLNDMHATGTAFIHPNIEDIVNVSLSFSSEIQAQLSVSWVHPYKEQRLVVIGTKGMLVFDDTLPFSKKLAWISEYRDSNSGFFQAKEETLSYLEVPEKDILKEECNHFLECCANRSSPKSSGEEAMAVLRLLEKCQSKLKPVSTPYFAHPTAIVEPGASIGKNTKIWHFAHVKSESKIGENCNLGQNVVVFPGAILGDNCKVQNNVSLYTGVHCEEDVFLGPSMVFTNVINPRSAVSRKHEYRVTTVRRGVTIGANATILCGIELGEYSFIGAGAVVTKSTVPFALMVGNPARQIGWMSRHGEKLNLPLYSEHPIEAICPHTGDVYVLDQARLTLLKNEGSFAFQ